MSKVNQSMSGKWTFAKQYLPTWTRLYFVHGMHFSQSKNARLLHYIYPGPKTAVQYIQQKYSWGTRILLERQQGSLPVSSITHWLSESVFENFHPGKGQTRNDSIKKFFSVQNYASLIWRAVIGWKILNGQSINQSNPNQCDKILREKFSL